MTFPLPCFTVFLTFCGSSSLWGLLQQYCFPSDPKSWNFDSSEKITQRLQSAYTTIQPLLLEGPMNGQWCCMRKKLMMDVSTIMRRCTGPADPEFGANFCEIHIFFLVHPDDVCSLGWHTLQTLGYNLYTMT
ncbi:hypothetical protein B0H11DRAFT_1922893 [Mycena galericulata]|nr:hypothetical protein B0H11DRAFT_1922893 [Mycena galericulata]